MKSRAAASNLERINTRSCSKNPKSLGTTIKSILHSSTPAEQLPPAVSKPLADSLASFYREKIVALKFAISSKLGGPPSPLLFLTPGRDSIPSWFLRIVAPFLAEPLSEVYNLSLNKAFVPKQWKSSIITPVAKTSKPAQCADFRPISVTPLLSRLLEKIVVSKFLYPALIHPKCEQLFRDQFAFRPTGSTTSALISLIHHVSSLLQNYPYVHVFALDFSKAFDTVRHSTLASKCADLPIEDEVHNWVLEFLDDRVHCTQFGGIISAERRINVSIVQGSGIGPVSYVICASDLQALHTGNAFDKYADDSYLIVPSINSSTIPDEFRHISDWASANNLKINTNKTKEMIFHGPRVNSQTFPPPLDGITRVTTMNVLGVHIQSNLSFRDHVDHLVRQSAQTMYALRILRHHGLCGPPLWEVAGATLMSRLTYASSAWWGFIDAEGRKRLNSEF